MVFLTVGVRGIPQTRFGGEAKQLLAQRHKTIRYGWPKGEVFSFTPILLFLKAGEIELVSKEAGQRRELRDVPKGPDFCIFVDNEMGINYKEIFSK